MDIFYFGTVRVAAVVFLLCSFLLFIQRKKGERSRLILSGILSMSVFSYLIRYIGAYYNVAPLSVTTVHVFLAGIFVVTTYITYLVEVISPEWITTKRLLKIYMPIAVLWGIYIVTLLLGVEYHPYDNLLQMLPDISRFDVWFRLILCVLIYLPAVFVFFVHRTRKYSNTNKIWVQKYVTVVLINSTAYILVIIFNDIYFHLFYYYCTIAATLYFTYDELYVRLISKEPIVEASDIELTKDDNHILLKSKLERLMDEEKPWQNPDLTIVGLSMMLCTNRTTLSSLIREMGYDSYPSFINRRRIVEFIKIIETRKVDSIEDTFFEVGFRSKVNALRYFRLITNTTPSEYLRRATDEHKEEICESVT